jgi:hypothetical protein
MRLCGDPKVSWSLTRRIEACLPVPSSGASLVLTDRSTLTRGRGTCLCSLLLVPLGHENQTDLIELLSERVNIPIQGYPRGGRRSNLGYLA